LIYSLFNKNKKAGHEGHEEGTKITEKNKVPTRKNIGNHHCQEVVTSG